MISLDTNILARYLLNDTPSQAIIAQQLLEREPFTVPITVFLELAWVLESLGSTRGEILAMSAGCSEFKTFDKALVKAAKRLATIPAASFP
ncbi:hypothetical protein SAMN05216319_4265 [Duganella sp. CF402]|uniref:PIN domain-containing protein n=1 Tax=unclassified Duganella TaxID=2636909 RepID=UPI0008C947C5|nr:MULTISPECIES: PIN domain-containing protein [unclassified Duganella]RZT03957.1 hypothetical protein EV582_4838 [Duganella sp. BK701]SEM53543.1 hypothetical protein SAMN05216319_4265 [Duganella sp. CF402]